MELYINPCIYSSFIFWINVFVGIYYQEYIYASLFVALFITSILFHSNLNNTLFLILDLLIVFSIFIYGGYRFVTKIKQTKISFFICFLFLLSLYLFFYGYYTNSYCYDVNKQIGNLYHSLLHIVSSLGHILVVLL
jgi:hypothetical protein